MGAWVKFFEDGSHELGTDDQVNSGEASWSKGRLDSIKEVHLTNKVVLASLNVPDTIWHQFDRFSFSFDTNTSSRLLRVVQAEIKEHHKDMFLLKEWAGKYLFWVSVENKNGIESIKITKDDIGKWITLVLPEDGHPYAVITSKGRF